MKLFGTAVFLGVSQRKANDGKTYNNVNLDFDGDIQSLGTQDLAPFLQLERYKPYTFILRYASYQKNGSQRSFLAVDGVQPQK